MFLINSDLWNRLIQRIKIFFAFKASRHNNNRHRAGQRAQHKHTLTTGFSRIRKHCQHSTRMVRMAAWLRIWRFKCTHMCVRLIGPFDNSADQNRSRCTFRDIFLLFIFASSFPVRKFIRMNKLLSNTMGVDIYKVIWLLLHFICDVIEYCLRLFHAVERKLKGRNQRESLVEDKLLIESTRDYLTKIPSHLVIILGTESPPDFKILSKLIFWSLSTGIQNISFYDHKGKRIFYVMKCTGEILKFNNCLLFFGRYFAIEKL